MFDCETDPFKWGGYDQTDTEFFGIRPFLIGYYDGEIYRAFEKVEEFIAFVRTQDVVCYAHNGGKFDFLYLVPHFDKNTKVFLINDRLASFKLGKCEFRDSYLILPIPLKAYKKDEIDYNLFTKENRYQHNNLQIIADYLENDCKYLYELVQGFREKFGTRMTIASTAMDQWSKISGHKTPKTSARFMDFWKQWYFGGRVEVFKPGIHEAKIKVLDINRAYSAGMKFHYHPWGSSVRKIDAMPKDYETAGRCFLEIEADCLGSYPMRVDRKDESQIPFIKPNGEAGEGLIFPNDGKRRTLKVTGWEYLSAVKTKTDGNAKILTIYAFDDKINFESFVDKFYDTELPKNSPEYLFKKLIGNSLYGKFAQDSRLFTEFFLVEQKDTLEKEVELGGKFSDFVGPWSLISRPLPEEKQNFYNIAVSASITGWVRAYLWESICASKGVYYCDTDCMHVEESHVKIGKELGLWKEEYEGTIGAYAGKKLYALTNKEGTYKIASKGARLTGPQIFNIARGEEIIYRQEAPTMSLRNGVKFQERRIKATY